MEERIINQKRIQQFSQYLAQEEKSAATVEKYLRDVQAFHRFVEGRPVNKELVIAYKKQWNKGTPSDPSIPCWLPSTAFWGSWAGRIAR